MSIRARLFVFLALVGTVEGCGSDGTLDWAEFVRKGCFGGRVHV